jgi:GT2 family glycosyltransferase
MSETNLTIIIVNWNNKKILQDCLESIYNTQNNYSYEIIVVDNNSKDGSAELIKNKFHKVILIENNKNYGSAKANNQAIKIAKTDHILLLNDDTIIKQNDCFMYGEDIEFCYRANKPGWKVGVLTNESIIHLLGKSSEKDVINIF